MSDQDSVWVAVEEDAWGDSPEVVMAATELDLVKRGYGSDTEWRRAGERWAAVLPEGVGGLRNPDASRVSISKIPLVEA